MHILYLPSWYPADASDYSGNFFREQAVAMHDHGLKVGVLAPMVRSLKHLPCGDGDNVCHFTREQGIPVFRVPLVNIFPRSGFLEGWWLRQRLLDAFREYIDAFGIPHLVHVQSMLPAGELALYLQANRGIPYIVTEHSTAYARGQLGFFRLRRARLIAKRASHRLAVSSPLSAVLEKLTPAHSLSWNRLPNVLPATFEAEARQFLRPTRPEVSGCTFLAVGTLLKKKRFDLLLDAFAMKYRRKQCITLRICGDGPEYQRLMQQARVLGISQQTAFLGNIPQHHIKTEYQKADIFVLPSDHETFGVVLIEATAMGLPVVATASGGPEDIVNPTNGRLVKKGSVQEFAAAMDHIRSNPSKYDSQKIRYDCLARFGREVFSTRLEAIYKAVLT